MRERKQLAYRCSPEEKRRLDHILSDLELTFQELVERALAKYLVDLGAQKPMSDVSASEPQSQHHQMLTEILASGDQAVIEAVSQNIEVFHDRLKKPPKKIRAAG